jgi:uncharacterized RDD family membrane protein YckC
MKLKPTPILSVFWLLLALAGQPVLRAQENPPPAPAAKPEEKPAATTAPAAAEAPAATENPAGQLRELGADDKSGTEPAKTETKRSRHASIQLGGRHSENERVSFFQDSTLAAGENADAVVSVFGSSTSAGEVGGAVVSVIGSSTSSGNVVDAVVSVIGSTRVTGGTVGDAAVAVLGNNYVDGHVKGEVVAVLGNVELGPDAVVDGQIVCIGGEVIRDGKAVVHGSIQHIAVGGHYFNFDHLHAWFSECLCYGRLLAFDSRVLWAWCIAFVLLGFYALLALITPAGVTRCVQTFEDQPGKSLLAALLTLLLTPVAYLLLVLTMAIGIGFVLIPLFSLGLFFVSIFGKVVMLAWFGRRFTRLLGDGPLAHPVFGVLIGGLVILGLYTVPVLGIIVYKLLGILGLGVVLYTLLLQYRASRPAPRPAAPVAAAGMAAPGLAPGVTPDESVPPPVPLPPVISAVTLPRAGFWIRLIASILDMIIMGMAFGMIHSIWRGLGGVPPFWYAAYCVVMWATKGTTIGGIVCGLKVVRLDDRPVDWSVAIVRALSGFLSLAVAGLGFIWVAFDDEKQSWHDKIAGTTIVRVPKGTALL